MRIRLAVVVALCCSASLAAQRGVRWDYVDPGIWFEVWVDGAYRSGVIAANQREWIFPAAGLGQGTHELTVRACTVHACSPVVIPVSCGVSECRGAPSSVVAPRSAGNGTFRTGSAGSVVATAIAYVRSARGQDYGGGASTTISTSAPITLTAGHTNIVAIRHVDATGVAVARGVVDAAGNTYLPVVGGSYRIAAGERLTLYYAHNVIGHAANVVTAIFSSSVQYRGIVTVEYAGLDATHLAGMVATGATTGETLTSPPFSAGPNALIFTVATVANVLTTWTAGTGYVRRGEDALRVTTVADRVVSDAQSGMVVSLRNSDGSSHKGMLVAIFNGAAP